MLISICEGWVRSGLSHGQESSHLLDAEMQSHSLKNQMTFRF